MTSAVPSGLGPDGSHGRANHTNAPTASERLRQGGFPLALAHRPRAVGPLVPGFHGLAVNPNGQGATSSKPGNNGQGAQSSGRSAPTASGPARQIQHYRPPQAAMMGHQAPAPEPLHTASAMNQLTRRPSSPPLSKGAQQLLRNPDWATALLSIACNIRQFNPAWTTNPTCGNWWSFSVRLENRLVPSAGEFNDEKRAKGETALKALKIMFDEVKVDKNEVLRRFYLARSHNNRPTGFAFTSTNHSDMAAVTTVTSKDVDMTGTNNSNMQFSMSMSGGAPVFHSTNPAGRLAQLPVSADLPSASHELHGLAAAIPSALRTMDEGHRILQSLGLLPTSTLGQTQPSEMSSAFLQGLAAGAQLSQMLSKNAPSECGRPSRRHRDRERDRQPRRDHRSRSPTTDRQPRRDRRSRSPTTDRQSAAAERRSRDPSLKLENESLQDIELRSDYHPLTWREIRPSTDRYRPSYDSKISKGPEAAIKKEASTESGSLLGATPGVSASSSGTGSRHRSSGASSRRGPSSMKSMPENEKWGHDGFAKHYPSGPKK